MYRRLQYYFFFSCTKFSCGLLHSEITLGAHARCVWKNSVYVYMMMMMMIKLFFSLFLLFVHSTVWLSFFFLRVCENYLKKKTRKNQNNRFIYTTKKIFFFLTELRLNVQLVVCPRRRDFVAFEKVFNWFSAILLDDNNWKWSRWKWQNWMSTLIEWGIEKKNVVEVKYGYY